MKAVDIINIANTLNISADYLLGIGKKDEKITDMVTKLSAMKRETVLDILEILVSIMKS